MDLPAEHKFFSIRRKADESKHNFVTRVWQTANPFLSEDIRDVVPTQVLIAEGGRGHYIFAAKLREMVNAGPADAVAIWASSFTVDERFHSVCYAYEYEDEDEDVIGAAFYAPRGTAKFFPFTE